MRNALSPCERDETNALLRRVYAAKPLEFKRRREDGEFDLPRERLLRMDAFTIISNCDTYIGGNDVETALTARLRTCCICPSGIVSSFAAAQSPL